MTLQFLNALKAKADKQAPKIEPKKIQPESIGAWTGKSTIPEQVQYIDSLLNGIQPTDNAQILINSKFGTEDQDFVGVSREVRIERVLDRNRIDVFFPEKPSDEIRTSLKDHGFRFNPESCAWYHRDTILNRVYLSEFLNAQGLLTSDDLDSIPSEVQGTFQKINDEAGQEPSEESGNEHYRKFKMQVNALQSELGLDAADLMLRAIDCLYNHVVKPH